MQSDSGPSRQTSLVSDAPDERATVLRRRVGAALLATGVAAAGIAAPAHAQTPAPTPADGESTFQRVMRTKTLRCGVVASGAPYYFKDLASGDWRGFYYDLYVALAKDLDVKLELHEVDWGGSVLELQSNKLDIFFGLTPTPKRALAIDFSDMVIQAASCIIAPHGFAAAQWTDLDKPNMRLAVDLGSSHDLTVTTNCPNAQILRLKSVPEATLALQSGRADAQICSNLLSMTIKKKNPAIGDIIYPKPMYFGTSSAGFRREADKTMQTVINYTIRYYNSFGFIRKLVMDNLDLVGVSQADWPVGVPI
jgi:polar amino acid transport system substrate-binding protein